MFCFIKPRYMTSFQTQIQRFKIMSNSAQALDQSELGGNSKSATSKENAKGNKNRKHKKSSKNKEITANTDHLNQNSTNWRQKSNQNQQDEKNFENNFGLRVYCNQSAKMSDIINAATTICENPSAVRLSATCYKVFMKTMQQAVDFHEYAKEKKIKGVVKTVFDKPNGHHKIGQNSSDAKEFYKTHWTKDEIHEGLTNGSLIKACIRLPPKNYQYAFVTNPIDKRDILIPTIKLRNRALEGDIVAIQLLPREDWVVYSKQTDLINKLKDLNISGCNNGNICVKDCKDKFDLSDDNLQKTAEVVGVLKEIRSRTAVGFIETSKFRNFVFFTPIDNGMPRILVPAEKAPKEFFKRPKDFNNKLYLAKIIKWDGTYAQGELLDGIGNSGEIEPETKRIITQCDIDDAEFPQSVCDSLPQDEHWAIPEKEIKHRRDLRDECIFTIDPPTARDLDDALHCKKIGDDLYEVGVHIADVSHFVSPESPVDNIASRRCTSVYLVQRVIPMLPRVLCDNLCSLHPGVDRLAFSVVWKINSKGEIKGEWFGRTIIHSCIQMSYDHAQSFIDAEQNGDEVSSEIFPEISGKWTVNNLKQKVLVLHTISQNMRKRRMDNGALRLDQIKLSYLINSETGMPDACFKYEYKKSNELIEEFMLLANIAVAHKLKKSVPKLAFLRSHPEPKEELLTSMADKCKQLGLDIDTKSSTSFGDSLLQAAGNDELSDYRLLALQLLAIKPQQLAIYFCAGSVKDEDDYWHYALNVPLYTHFTSPIRRYADLIVHRQLAAVVDEANDDYKEIKTGDLQVQADLCNQRKVNSKRAQDASIELFFTAMLKNMERIEGKGIVVQILDRSFDVLSIEYGFIKRVYCEEMPLLGFKSAVSTKHKGGNCLKLMWNNDNTDNYKRDENAPNASISSKPALVQSVDMFDVVRFVLEYAEWKNQPKIKSYIKRNPDLLESN